MKLKDNVAIVTGSSQGIGRGIALALAKEGADVVITSRTQEKNEKVANEVRGLGRRSVPVRCDVSIEDDVKHLIKETLNNFGQIDILVNNAGIAGPMDPVASMDLEGWNKTLAINLTGTMLCSREVLKEMIKRRTGNVVMVSSNVGRRALPNRTPYVCSKWAQIGFTQTLAHEVAPYNVRVNAVCPGAVEGERIRKFIKHRAQTSGISFEEALKQTEADALLNRLITPQEVANAVIFFVSSDGSGITGQSLNVCGGTVFS